MLKTPCVPGGGAFMYGVLVLLTCAYGAGVFGQCGDGYREVNGIICWEAEHFAKNNGYEQVEASWATGGKAMRASSAAKSVDYTIHVSTAGRWWVWVRHYSTNYEDNGMFLALDGRDVKSDKGHNIIRLQGKYYWHLEFQCGEGCHYGPVYVDLTPGKHTFTVKKRETGATVDKFLLTTVKDGPARAEKGPDETPACASPVLAREPLVAVPPLRTVPRAFRVDLLGRALTLAVEERSRPAVAVAASPSLHGPGAVVITGVLEREE